MTTSITPVSTVDLDSVSGGHHHRSWGYSYSYSYAAAPVAYAQPAYAPVAYAQPTCCAPAPSTSVRVQVGVGR